MFGRRPTGRLLYAWDFAEVRWQKIRELGRFKVSAVVLSQSISQGYLQGPEGHQHAERVWLDLYHTQLWPKHVRNSSRTSPGEQAEGLPDPSCYWWRHGFYSQAWAWEDDLLDEARPHIRSELSGTNV